LTRADGSRFAVLDGQTIEIADDKSNADTFWFASDVTIMDAQGADRLKLYGITLTGGDTTATTAALTLGAFNPLFGAGVAGAAAAANFSRIASGQPLIYFDRFIPFITYKLVDGAQAGTQDLIVGNVLDSFLGVLNGSPDESRGTLRVVDFDRGAGRIFSATGDLGINLDDFYPLAILSLLAPRLAGVPIAQSLMVGLMALATAATVNFLAYKYNQFAKDNGWLDEKDPLIIDLDGDGIETIGLSDSNAYFDVDGDYFRERTGWVKGDDGFLVLDSNNNGRIDDLSEMFGNQFEGGYDELRGYDSNGDGRISIGDLVWSELRIWQDRDGDGETDAGELSSLTQLGIIEISLTNAAVAGNDNEYCGWRAVA
jgi:hypothetical protein